MKMRVTVCLSTFRRASVVHTLESVAAQELPPHVALDVVVVDSDCRDGSAADRVAAAATRLPVPIRYVRAERPGVAEARNKAISEAEGDWLAFIDDDEAAAPDWIAQLVACAQAHAAQAVVGSVHTLYPPGCPEWISSANLFGKNLPPTGMQMDSGATCNAIVARSALAGEAPVFDPAYGRTGGEDTDLFARLARRGVMIVSCREAVVSETVEPARLNRDFLLARAMRVGETYFRIFIADRRPPRRAVELLRAGLQWAAASLIAAVLRPAGEGRSMVFRIKAAANLGKLRAASGVAAIEIYKG